MKTIKVTLTSVLLLFFFAEVTFIACVKTNSERQAPSGVLVTASIAGRVTDQNKAPVSNASVIAGTSATTTDNNGRFSIQNVKLVMDAGYVQVTMPGFFTGSRTFAVNANGVNNIEIQLIPKTISGNFTAGSSGNVDITGGGSVSFISGNVVKASNGKVYAGNVSVASQYLNPTDGDFNKFMPGDLRGVTANNQKGFLTVYSMSSVELDDTGGEKLQLAEGAGNTATLRMPIPAALQNSAPATIPLWFMDETTGLWKQEGTATKQGNNYEGTVSHFSFWAAGQLGQSITLRASFTLDTSHLPFANKLVTIMRTDSTSTNGYTDSTGTLSGLVPANEVLNMKVFNDCNESVYNQVIGPFNTDTDLGTISVQNGPCYTMDTSQFIKLLFDSKAFTWTSFHIFEGFVAGSHTIMVGGSPGNPSDTSAGMEGLIFGGVPAPGDYPISLYLTIGGTPQYQAGGMSYDPSYPYPIATVTKFEEIGGYIEGTIAGNITTFPSVPNATSFPVTGSFRLKRTQ